jgi:hypothetical protein
MRWWSHGAIYLHFIRKELYFYTTEILDEKIRN